MSNAKPSPSLSSQASLIESMLYNGVVDAYRKHRKFLPGEDALIAESLQATVRALREFCTERVAARRVTQTTRRLR